MAQASPAREVRTVTEPGIIPAVHDWQGSAQLHRYFVCDVFTSEPLAGNQLAVFVDGRPFDAARRHATTRSKS